jgi:hypothetical protein
MGLSHDPLRISASFDDPDLVSRGGLVPVMALAERAGLQALVRRHVAIAAKTGVYPDVTVGCLVAGMAAGADSIDDMDLLRPQPADPAPAAVLAPRKRMAEPVRGRLRAARLRRLTSPDTVTAPQAHDTPPAQTPIRTQGQAADR